MTASRSAAEIFEGAGKPAFVRGYKRSKLDRVSKRRSIESRSDPLNERRGMTVLSRCTPTNEAPCNGRTLQGPKSSKDSPTGVGSRVLWAGSIQIFGGLRSPRSRDKSCCCSISIRLSLAFDRVLWRRETARHTGLTTLPSLRLRASSSCSSPASRASHAASASSAPPAPASPPPASPPASYP